MARPAGGTTMNSPNRRSFIKIGTALGAAATGVTPTAAHAKPRNILSPDRMGVLVDTTVCIGCRHCEWACKEAHGLPTPPLESYEDRTPFDQMRRPDDTALTVVNRYDNPKNPDLPYTVKVQCMHCDHPACVSACIVGALSKEENGAVIWDTNKCIGCRYCMVACPFQIPAFEYLEGARRRASASAISASTDRRRASCPACVEICPVEALHLRPARRAAAARQGAGQAAPGAVRRPRLRRDGGRRHRPGATSPAPISRVSGSPSSRTGPRRVCRRASSTGSLPTSFHRSRCTPCSAPSCGSPSTAAKKRRPDHGPLRPSDAGGQEVLHARCLRAASLLAANGLVFLAGRFLFGLGAVTQPQQPVSLGHLDRHRRGRGRGARRRAVSPPRPRRTSCTGSSTTPMVRPALLTAMLGYTFVAVGRRRSISAATTTSGIRMPSCGAATRRCSRSASAS